MLCNIIYNCGKKKVRRDKFNQNYLYFFRGEFLFLFFECNAI